jgi:D-3-phosphoglycerate dehydrogenase
VIAAGKSLKVISKHGSGIDTIDVAAANERSIEVKAAIGANSTAVAEHALSLLLTCSKSVIALNTRMHAGHWDKSTHKSIELKGKTLGLIGLGAIGRQVASFAHALGMKIIGYDPFSSHLPDYIQPGDLETIWKAADAISLHCPLTAENTDLINRDTIQKMKPGVIIINTARGGLINEQALLEGINSGKIKCAGIDSFKQEPPSPDHPFFGNPQIVLTPHIGGVSTEAYINMGCAAAQNVLDVLSAKLLTPII